MKNSLRFALIFAFILMISSCVTPQKSHVKKDEVVTIFVFDNSGSMRLRDKTSGVSSITSAKQNALNVASKLKISHTKIALVEFGKSCKDVQIDLIPSNNLSEFRSKIEKIGANNLTSPLALTIKEAGNLGVIHAKRVLNLVIITDGTDSCNGHAQKEIATLVRENQHLKINSFIIGYNIHARDTERRLKPLVTGNGGYYRSNEIDRLVQILNENN